MHNRGTDKVPVARQRKVQPFSCQLPAPCKRVVPKTWFSGVYMLRRTAKEISKSLGLGVRTTIACRDNDGCPIFKFSDSGPSSLWADEGDLLGWLVDRFGSLVLEISPTTSNLNSTQKTSDDKLCGHEKIAAHLHLSLKTTKILISESLSPKTSNDRTFHRLPIKLESVEKSLDDVPVAYKTELDTWKQQRLHDLKIKIAAQDEELRTTQKIGAYLGVSERTVRTYKKMGMPVWQEKLGHMRIDCANKSEVDEWIRYHARELSASQTKAPKKFALQVYTFAY